MSSFIMTVRDKGTGVLHEAWAFDDYFGRHEYGYQLVREEEVYTYDEFFRKYEREHDL